ncbi:MAG: CocE/NonD family hydrolase [Ignavibacteriales bacterium]
MDLLSFRSKKSTWKKALIWGMVLCFSLGVFAFPQQAQAAGYTLKYMTIPGGPTSETDSTPLKVSAHIYYPKSPMPEGGYPAILFIHSWALQQNEYDAKMAEFASKGYITICYTCRGWYGAPGNTGIASPPEIQDINKVIDWLIANTPVNPDKIGATGISYGGGQSLLALKFEPRIKTVVAMSGWTNLVESLVPNRTFKASWASFLAITGYIMANPDDTIKDFCIGSLNYVNQNLNPAAQVRSIATYIDEINAREEVPPVFIIQGINEDLFTTRQMVDFYSNYAGPKKITLANGVHATAEASGLFTIPNANWTDALKWFNYWLKGEQNGIMSQKPFSVYQKWTNTQALFDSYPLTNQSITLYPTGDGILSSTQAATEGSITLKNNPKNINTNSGLFYISPMIQSHAGISITGADPSKLGVGATAFETVKLTQDITAAGVPSFHFLVKPDKNIFQLDFFIYDVDQTGTAKLLYTVPYTNPQATAGAVNMVDVDLNNVLYYRFVAGHKIRVVVATSNSVYVMPVTDAFSVDLLTGSGTSMMMPVIP